MAEDLPPLVTKLTADLGALDTGLARGEASVKAWKQEVAAQLGGGKSIGEGFGRGLSDGIQDAIPDGGKVADQVTGRLRDARGRFIKTGQDLGAGLGEGIPQGVDPGLDAFHAKVTAKTRDAAKDAADGMSPLLTGAFIAAAQVGPAALLAGTAGAVVGVGALIAKSNVDIQAEYKTLASDVGREMTDAVSPLVPAVQAAMTEADRSIQQIAPDIKGLFTAAEPEVTQFAGGLTGLAGHALPGLTTAIDQSRVIVTRFTGELPTLGTGVGSFFTGLTTDSQSTARGIKDFVDVSSNALGTLGHVAGSASAALSTDFAAVTPVLNGALSAINTVASPATVGGLIGLAGAMKFDPAIAGGLQKISNGFVGIASKAEGATGLVGKAGATAEGAASGFGKMADVVGGPWGVAIGAGVGLLGGLVSTLHQSIATASDFTAAVAQDNGVVGASTTAIIQKKIATLDLNSVQQELGVSESTLIEYAAGEKSAQDQVRAAYNSKIQALQQSAKLSDQNTQATVQSNQAAAGQEAQLHGILDSVDQVTTAVRQAIDAQNEQNKAYLAATKSAGIFAGLVDSGTTALQTQANQAAISTVASLQLGTGQAQLGQQLSNVVYNYQLAASGGQAYGNVMTALNGTTSALEDAQNTLAQDTLNASSSFKANKYSLDLSTQAGINNREALSAASKAIIQMGVDQYQASGDINQANATVQTQIEKFVAATGATGKQKKAIEDYLDQITKIPPDVSTDFHANTGPATKALSSLIEKINTSYGTVQVHINTSGLGMGTNRGAGTPSYDFGGWTKAAPGQPEPAIVHGGEYVLSQGMLSGRQAVDPQVLAALRSAGIGIGTPATSPAGGTALAGGGSGDMTLIVPVYLDGKLVGRTITRTSRAQAQQYKARNSTTGFN